MTKAEHGVHRRIGLTLSLLGAVATTATGSAQTAATYGLKAGKPYAGTEVKFLICCATAGQFAQMIKLTGPGSEFEKLTGITVKWENTPYEALQQKILVEATTGNTYDAVAWVDAWGEAFKSQMMPLNSRIAADKINMKDYPNAYLSLIHI